jgi:MFS family permease
MCSLAVLYVNHYLRLLNALYICDNYGRRISNILAASLSVITVLATTFSVNWYMYAGLRFLTGIASFAAYEAGFVFAMEIVGEKYRSQFGFSIFFLFEFGICMLSPMRRV